MSGPPDVAGTPLSGGTYEITPAANALVCRSSGGTVALDGTAHPAFALIAPQVAMTLSVAELLAICDFDVADGPMMAGCKVEFSQPLLVATPYHVSGQIESLTRKASRTLGVMDMLVHRLDLHDGAGALVSRTSNTWVLPRKGLA